MIEDYANTLVFMESNLKFGFIQCHDIYQLHDFSVPFVWCSVNLNYEVIRIIPIINTRHSDLVKNHLNPLCAK